jgi:hypothetical protein
MEMLGCQERRQEDRRIQYLWLRHLGGVHIQPQHIELPAFGVTDLLRKERCQHLPQVLQLVFTTETRQRQVALLSEAIGFKRRQGWQDALRSRVTHPNQERRG